MAGLLRVFLAISVVIILCGSLAYGGEVEDLVVMRDTLRPNSSEAAMDTYKTIPWVPNERAFILKSLRRIHALAPGLLPRAASDGTLSVYRSNLRTYAKGGTKLIVIGKMVFAYPDFSFRVVFHETVHAADNYHKLSNSNAFRKIFEPKIEAARVLLAKEGLTPARAAALPLGERRKRIEKMVRTQTGLPSAYAAYSLSECLSEVVSFWLTPEFNYTPSPAVVRLLSPFVSQAAPPDPVDQLFRQAERSLRHGDFAGAAKKASQVIKADPTFYQAYSLRGYAYLKLKKNKYALRDLKKAHELVPPLQGSYAFYDKEYKRVRALVQKGP